MWSSRARPAFALWLIVSTVPGVLTAAPASAQAPAPAPASSPASSPAPASEASRVESSTGRPIVWVGATIFSLSYIAAALAATTSYTSDVEVTTPHGALWIPAVGPFIVMGKTSGAGDEILLALDGLAQIGGLTLFIYGQTTPKSAAPSPSADRNVTISIAPLVTRTTGGVAVFASF